MSRRVSEASTRSAGFGFDDKQSLAIWVDALTFICSAILISGLALPGTRRASKERIQITQTFRDVLDGLKFIRSDPLVRGVMIGLAGGLIGGGAVIPLGPVLADSVLGGGSGSFGLLMTALGLGAAIGVVSLIVFQRRRKLPNETGVHGGRHRHRHVAHRDGIRVDADTGAVPHRGVRRDGRLRVRHRFHAAAGARERRVARAHVRDPVHDRAAGTVGRR